MARVRSVEGISLLSGPGTLPSGSLHTDKVDRDEAYIMGYVVNIENLDMDNPKEAENLLHNWLPDIEVLEITGHN